MLAEYLFRINGHAPSAWELKGTAVAAYTVAVLRKSSRSRVESLNNLYELVLVFNNRVGFLLSNGIGIVKVVTIVL